MAEEKVAVEVSVSGDGKAKQSVASLRQQIREATQEAGRYAQQFGLADDRTVEAAKHLAELKETWQKTQELAAGFNPDRKFQALSTAIRGTLGGFEAFQGAIGLLGTKSKELEDQLLKVQSAMALTQGLNEIMALKDSFLILVTVVKDYLVNAFRALKTAIGSTGIGLLVIALGALWANWDKVKKIMTDTFPVIKDITENWDKFKQVLMGVANVLKEGILGPINAIKDAFQGDFKKALQDILKGGDIVGNFEAGKAQELQDQREEQRKKDLESLIKHEEQKINVLKASGKETYELERQNLLRKINLAAEDKEKYDELYNELDVLDATHQKKLADDAKRRSEEAKKRAEEKKRLEEQEWKDRADRTRAWLALIDEYYDSARKIREQKEAEAAKKEKDAEDQRFQDMDADAQRINEQHAKNTEAEVLIDQKKLEAKQELAAAEMSILSSVSELVGRQTAAGKAIAVAQTAISTYSAAQKAYESQMAVTDPSAPIRAAIAAGAAILAGLAKVKAILAVKVPGATVATPTLPNVSNGASSSLSNFSQAQAVKLDSNSINQMGNQQNIRVQVVERDITRTQGRIDRIQRAAVIGG